MACVSVSTNQVELKRKLKVNRTRSAMILMSIYPNVLEETQEGNIEMFLARSILVVMILTL